MEIGGQLHAPPTLPPQMNPGAHGTGGWTDPKAGLDNLEKRKLSCPCQDSNAGSLFATYEYSAECLR